MKLTDRLQNIITQLSPMKDFDRALISYYKGIQTSPFICDFSPDNAYEYIKKQVSFGPRVPGSQASIRCAKWIELKLKEFGVDNIQEQHSQLIAYNGDKFDAINISAQINPDSQNRIILLSHWDSRPWADNDRNPANRTKPIDGANDGASGVSVILEMARIFADNRILCGIDILFVDAEDYGQRIGDTTEEYDEYSWCLGTQYWMNNPTLDLSRIDFAILLDMVGGKDAVFSREYFSQKEAGLINDILWQSARIAGHADSFQDIVGNAVIDDHVYFLLNRIPAIAIIESNHPVTGFFCPTWHTLDDTIENIDMKTLKAVGETLELFLKEYKKIS